MFKPAWNLYENSFPTIEKRTKQEQDIAMQKEAYTFMTCHNDNVFIGIIGFWKIADYLYIEHFAIDKLLRGQNYGSIVLTHFLKEYKNIFLEIEPPICNISKRRLNFYQNLGFVENNIAHFQVPFRKNDILLPLTILSFEVILEQKVYDMLYTNMKFLLPGAY